MVNNNGEVQKRDDKEGKTRMKLKGWVNHYHEWTIMRHIVDLHKASFLGRCLSIDYWYFCGIIDLVMYWVTSSLCVLILILFFSLFFSSFVVFFCFSYYYFPFLFLFLLPLLFLIVFFPVSSSPSRLSLEIHAEGKSQEIQDYAEGSSTDACASLLFL